MVMALRAGVDASPLAPTTAIDRDESHKLRRVIRGAVIPALRISLLTAFTAHYFTAHCIHCALVSGLQRGEADGQSFARARQRPAVSVEKCARPAVASPPDLYSIPVPGRKASAPAIPDQLFVDASRAPASAAGR